MVVFRRNTVTNFSLRQTITAPKSSLASLRYSSRERQGNHRDRNGVKSVLLESDTFRQANHSKAEDKMVGLKRTIIIERRHPRGRMLTLPVHLLFPGESITSKRPSNPKDCEIHAMRSDIVGSPNVFSGEGESTRRCSGFLKGPRWLRKDSCHPLFWEPWRMEWAAETKQDNSFVTIPMTL